MAIESITFDDFTVFGQATFELSPGINVIMGKNGCGKTHAMKAAYVLHRALKNGEKDSELEKSLVEVFRPDHIGRLVHRRGKGNTGRVSAVFDEGRASVEITTRKRFKSEVLPTSACEPSVFVPSREALAMYRGFIAAYLNRELSFDRTYFDLCVALSSGLLKGPRGDRAKELAKTIEDALEGRVVLENDQFYLKRKDGTIEAPLVSEGFRKLASIVHLIHNGSIAENGVLFWDEPEANLNPALIAPVVALLRTLAASRVQVVVATHDLLFSQRLSMATEYGADTVDTKFFSLYRPDPDSEILVDSARTLPGLKENAILEEHARYFEDEQALASAAVARLMKKSA